MMTEFALNACCFLSAVTMPTSGSSNLVTLSASGEKVTPQEALLHTMAAAHQKAQESTGVSIPKYYNPAAVNPMKYAEQVQKRKLLWGKGAKEKGPEQVRLNSSNSSCLLSSNIISQS
jgi:hypothetical protein